MKNQGKSGKKLAAVLLIVCLAGLTATGCTRDQTREAQTAASKALQKTVQYYENKGGLDHWEEAVAMYGASKSDQSAAGWKDWKLPITEKPDGSASGYAGAILLQAAEGASDEKSAEALAALQNPVQGNFQSDYINQHIWAMIAMNVEAGTERYDYGAAVKYLLTFQGPDGGFDYDPGSGDAGDPDLTGIAAIALAPYYKAHPDEDSMKKLTEYFKESQTSDGGYQGMAGENPSTVASVIWGITALNQELPVSKDGKTPLDALLSFQNSDGSFRQQKDPGQADPMATRQAAIALDDIVNGADVYQLLSEDMQKYGKDDTSDSAISFSIVYPKEAELKNVENEEVAVKEGETPLEALQNYGKQNKLPVVQKDGYVTGINGVSEKGYGPQSGWVYLVNGVTPGMAADVQTLKPGDRLEWRYVTTAQELKDLESAAPAVSGPAAE